MKLMARSIITLEVGFSKFTADFIIKKIPFRNFRSGSRKNFDSSDSFNPVWLPYLSLIESCLLHRLFAIWSVFVSLISRTDNIVQRLVVHMLFCAFARKLSYTVPNISANNPNDNDGRIHLAFPTLSFNVVNSNEE